MTYLCVTVVLWLQGGEEADAKWDVSSTEQGSSEENEDDEASGACVIRLKDNAQSVVDYNLFPFTNVD